MIYITGDTHGKRTSRVRRRGSRYRLVGAGRPDTADGDNGPHPSNRSTPTWQAGAHIT